MADIHPLASYHLDKPDVFKQKALAWASRFDHCLYLDHNGLYYPHGGFRNLLAVGSEDTLQAATGGQSLDRLYEFHQKHPDWLFGFMAYDLKNELEALESTHPFRVAFPHLFFFKPKFLLEFTGSQVWVHRASLPPSELMALINEVPLGRPTARPPFMPVATVERYEYVQKVRAIQEHILDGDVYELNYCMEFFVERAPIDPLDFFHKLNAASPMPFAAFMRHEGACLACASPERFLKKDGHQLIAQPVKGTACRASTTPEDFQHKQQLFNSEKERAENLMIVDLMRNDLARSALPGSVRVEELFQVIGFKHVYQMLSTVTAKLQESVPFTKALAHAFPMGSMTGAPKVRAIQLIEQFEKTKRGLYSGSVGYITPEGDFDFNVVIRSLLYQASNQALSFEVGSAITSDADPEMEYEECLLKAKAIMDVLRGGEG